MKLKSLYLESPRITSTGLKNLERLTQLERLHCLYLPIDDDGLACLKGLSLLKQLGSPGGSQITDAGLARLAGLSFLEYLHLTDCQITDEGLTAVARLTHLIRLDLSGSKITDVGLNRPVGCGGWYPSASKARR
jgi:hypothetical protein